MMSKPWSFAPRARGGVIGLVFAVQAALPLLSAPAAAQKLAIPRADKSAEAALPDMDALEKGARPRASVSFAPPALSADGDAPAEAAQEDQNGNGEAPALPPRADNVRRLAAPPPPGLVRRSGIYGMESLVPLDGGDDVAPADQGNGDHVVRDGETMTSVCEQYFSDPGCWPRLWAGNPQVTNPHWIFPGDVIHLRKDAPGARPAPPATPGKPQGMRISSNRKGSLDNRGVLLRETGFIDKDAMAAAGKVTGSREEKIMLATGDQAYVGFPAGKPLRAGERYTIFVADTSSPVKSPDTGEVLGYMVRVYGEILVDQITDGNVARGTLADLAEPVERGFAVSPRVKVFKHLEPKPATANLEARVIASFSPSIMLAAENFVVLSRGGKDGLEVGNRIFVVRRGDGYRPVMEGWDTHDTNFPKELVAELWVVDVRDKAAVAWVARSSKELRVGEVAELRKGH
jgi:hypothetical protein